MTRHRFRLQAVISILFSEYDRDGSVDTVGSVYRFDGMNNEFYDFEHQIEHIQIEKSHYQNAICTNLHRPSTDNESTPGWR